MVGLRLCSSKKGVKTGVGGVTAEGTAAVKQGDPVDNHHMDSQCTIKQRILIETVQLEFLSPQLELLFFFFFFSVSFACRLRPHWPVSLGYMMLMMDGSAAGHSLHQQEMGCDYLMLIVLFW